MNYSLDGAPIQAELDLLLLIACPETFLGSQELNFCFLIKKKKKKPFWNFQIHRKVAHN